MDFREALKLARKELEEFHKDRESLRLRNACEKGAENCFYLA